MSLAWVYFFLTWNSFALQADGVRKTNSLRPSAPPDFPLPLVWAVSFWPSPFNTDLAQSKLDGWKLSCSQCGLGPGIGLPCASVPSQLTSSLSHVIYQLPLIITKLSLTYIPVYWIFIIKTLLLIVCCSTKDDAVIIFFLLGPFFAFLFLYSPIAFNVLLDMVLHGLRTPRPSLQPRFLWGQSSWGSLTTVPTRVSSMGLY